MSAVLSCLEMASVRLSVSVNPVGDVDLDRLQQPLAPGQTRGRRDGCLELVRNKAAKNVKQIFFLCAVAI